MGAADLASRQIEPDPPVFQADKAGEMSAGKLDGVHAGHEGLRLLRRDGNQQPHHLLGAGWVEGCNGLVSGNDQGVLDEEPRDGNPLLLAPRETARPLGGPAADADTLEGADGPALVLGPGQGQHRFPEPPGSEPSGEHVVEHREIGDEVELLMDHANEARESGSGPMRATSTP